MSRTYVVVLVAGILAFAFGLLAPEGGWAPWSAFLGGLAIMLVVGGLGWHSNLFGRPRR